MVSSGESAVDSHARSRAGASVSPRLGKHHGMIFSSEPRRPSTRQQKLKAIGHQRPRCRGAGTPSRPVRHEGRTPVMRAPGARCPRQSTAHVDLHRSSMARGGACHLSCWPAAVGVAQRPTTDKRVGGRCTSRSANALCCTEPHLITITRQLLFMHRELMARTDQLPARSRDVGVRPRKSRALFCGACRKSRITLLFDCPAL